MCQRVSLFRRIQYIVGVIYDMLPFIVAAVIILIIYYNVREPFSAQRHAEGITSWFQSRAAPSYTAYKREIPDSNIVEYESVLKLYQSGRPVSVDDVKRALA